MEKRLRVVQLVTDNREPFREYDRAEPWFGAAPEALFQGFEELPDEVEVHVVTCTQRPMQSPARLAPNVHFHSLHVPKIGWLRTGYQGCIRAARRRIRDIAPDLVHGQGTERDCAVSAVLSGYPNVVTIHGNMAELGRRFGDRPLSFGWLAARIEDWTLPRTQGVLCNSAYTEGLVQPRARRVWRVPNALREIFFAPPRGATRAEGVPLLLNVGVISPRKRQVELIQALRLLWARGFAFRLNFVGNGDTQSEYGRRFFQLISEPDVQAFVSFLGPRGGSSVLAEFDRADGFIHFPSEEAFGLVAAEALARNVKFFGASVGGVAEIAAGVPETELVPAEDWPALIQAIEHWLKAGAHRPTGARPIMEQRFHPRVIAGRHLEIYREVLSAGGR